MNGRTNTSGITVNNGISIPLEAPTNLMLSAGDQEISMTWTDPIDKYTETFNELVSQWSYDTIVRKEGSVPSSPHDGTVVAKITSKNQHQNIPFTDTGMENDKRWYYSVYSWNQFGTKSEPASGSGIPTGTIINQYKTTLSSRASDIRGQEIAQWGFVFGSTRNHLVVIDPNVKWFAYNSNLVKSDISNHGNEYREEVNNASSTTVGYYANFFNGGEVGASYNSWKTIDDNLVVSEHPIENPMNHTCVANVNTEIGIVARDGSGYMFNENLVLQSIETPMAYVPLSTSSYAGFDGDIFYDVDGVSHDATPDLARVVSSTRDNHYMIFYGEQKAAAIDDRTLVAQSINGIWNVSDNYQENEESLQSIGIDCQTIGCGLIFKFGSGMGSMSYGGTDVIDRNLVLSDGSSVFPFTESHLGRDETLDVESSVLQAHRFGNYVAIPLTVNIWDSISTMYDKRMAVYIIENGYESNLEEV